MPRKIRELRSELRRAGFVAEPGRGSHEGWRHPLMPDKFTLAGGDGDDAKPYQEKHLRLLLAKLRTMQGNQT